MRKLTLNDDANLFIITTYTPNKPPEPIWTPFGTSKEIFVNKVLKPTQPSEIGSESYRASLSRAFNRAKQQIFFNPDMTKFITLTYAENMEDPDKLLYDVKLMIKNQKRSTPTVKPKYLYIIEKQERGALHVHMIANDFLETYQNRNGHPSITYWPHGINSILDIKGADTNFKPYLYLFKYMKKSQRIGDSFIHSSRNLNNFTELTDFEFHKKLHEKTFSEEVQQGYLDKTIKRSYYKKRQ